MTRREGGQSLVEFAITLPLLTLFIMTVIQLSLLLVTYYSQTRMARETARWLAVNRNASDLQVAQHVQTTMLPGLVGATPSGRTVSGAVVQYTVGNMTTEFTRCESSGSNENSTSCNARVPGATLYVQMTYNAQHLIFLPAEFRMGSLVTTVPTALPPYRVSVMVE